MRKVRQKRNELRKRLGRKNSLLPPRRDSLKQLATDIEYSINPATAGKQSA